MANNKCITCKFYYITWDQRRPYGCRAFGFKAKRAPFIVVEESSGEECHLYEKREKGEKRGR